MRSEVIIRWGASLALITCACLQPIQAHGDEPGRFGRLFRFGQTNDSSKSVTPPLLGTTPGATVSSPGANPAFNPSAPYRSLADSFSPPALSTPMPPATGPAGSTATPRITPKPRVNKPITEADPLVTRMAVGRADGGSQFGMFMQVFADGTVIDGEGVHKVSSDALKPVVEAVSSGDFNRLKGHCGGPAGDTFENIHVVTFERAYGRLRANPFSYSGNPQGCDHAVHHLHKVLDDLQMKMSTPGAASSASASTSPMIVAPASSSLGTTLPTTGGPVPMTAAIPLTMPSLPDPGLH